MGVEIFNELLCIDQVKNASGFTLQKTQLGWIISGRCPSNSLKGDKQLCNITINDNSNLDQLIKKFWEIEEYHDPPIFNKSEQYCETFFESNYKRDDRDRFIVKLPFKSKLILGDTKQIATKRFKNLEIQLSKRPEFKSQYNNFIKEYIELGHMKLIEQEDPCNAITFYFHITVY